MSMQELFDRLGITDDRTRILAVVSSPHVFFDRCTDEDHAMMTASSFVCHTFMKMVEIPNEYGTHLEACYRNIQYALFKNNPKVRDHLYAMRNPEYLDSVIAWAKSLVQIVKDKHKEFTRDYHAFITNETGIPVFEFHKEYEEYNERQSKA